MSEPDQNSHYDFNVPAIYLNMARAMFCKILPYEGCLDDEHQFETQKINTAYGVMGVSIVFSYQAIEAFSNSQLWRLWIMKPQSPEREQMLKVFKNPDSFKAIKEQKLGDKMKKLSKALGISSPSADHSLWNEFKNLSEDARHFIVHPSPEYFDNYYDKIMLETKAGRYVEVAISLIGHYFDKMHAVHPAWLQSNAYFSCEGFRTHSPLK